MAMNEVFKDADSLSWKVGGSGFQSGMFVLFNGNVRGVCETDATLGEDGNYYVTVRHVGVFTGNSADAFVAGQEVYINGIASFDVTDTPGNLVGYAIKDKAAGAGQVFVRVNN